MTSHPWRQLDAYYQQRADYAETVRDLKAERVDHSLHTPAELVAIQERLKADYYAREAQRRAAA